MRLDPDKEGPGIIPGQGAKADNPRLLLNNPGSLQRQINKGPLDPLLLQEFFAQVCSLLVFKVRPDSIFIPVGISKVKTPASGE